MLSILTCYMGHKKTPVRAGHKPSLLLSGCPHQAYFTGHLPGTGGCERCLIDTHMRGRKQAARSDAPYLPRLLQLGRPPLLQDGLHGTDEFCSDVLENNSVIFLLTSIQLVCRSIVIIGVCPFCSFGRASIHSAAVVLGVSV